MPLTTPEGAISLPEIYLAATLAACARWQTMTGISSAVADLAISTRQFEAAHIYFDALPAPPNDQPAFSREQLDAFRPYVVLHSDEETGLTFLQNSHSSPGFGFRENGVIKGFIEIGVAPELAHNTQEVFRRAKNDVGVLFGEAIAFAGQAGYLALTSLTLRGPLRVPHDNVQDEGDFLQYLFTANWGLSS